MYTQVHMYVCTLHVYLCILYASACICTFIHTNMKYFYLNSGIGFHSQAYLELAEFKKIL